MFLASLEGIPTPFAWRTLLLRLCEAAICVRALWLRIVSRRCWLGRRGLLVDAVLVVLVILSPVVAIVRILLCSYPFLRLGAVNVSLIRHGLVGGEGALLAIAAIISMRR